MIHWANRVDGAHSAWEYRNKVLRDLRRPRSSRNPDTPNPGSRAISNISLKASVNQATLPGESAEAMYLNRGGRCFPFLITEV